MSNPQEPDLNETWAELVTLIDDLPEERRTRLRAGFATFIHDVRSSLGIIYSAEGLLRRVMPSDSPDIELLDMIRNSDRKAIALLADLTKALDTGQATD